MSIALLVGLVIETNSYAPRVFKLLWQCHFLTQKTGRWSPRVLKLCCVFSFSSRQSSLFGFFFLFFLLAEILITNPLLIDYWDFPFVYPSRYVTHNQPRFLTFCFQAPSAPPLTPLSEKVPIFCDACFGHSMRQITDYPTFPVSDILFSVSHLRVYCVTVVVGFDNR